MENRLYGDGIHDDTSAIQEMIDGAGCELSLPAPEKFYLISRSLELPSNFRFTLPRFAEIRLAKDSNCLMLKNKMTPDPECKERSYCKIYKDTPESMNIELSGGIWNCNNLEQEPNPIQKRDRPIPEYWGYGMLFFKVKNLKVSSLTIMDPPNFGITFDTVSYFTVEDITFDYKHWKPLAINMDGVHFDGNCHYGVIRNLKGSCFDDLVALNAPEGSCGPITNIEIDGIFAENCHSAVRLLNNNEAVEKIHISNVFGTYYQYCIGLTRSKYDPEENDGYYDAITLDHIYASKAVRTVFLPWQGDYVYSFFSIDPNVHVKNLIISDFHRREREVSVETVRIHNDTVVDRLTLENITVENSTGKEFPLLSVYSSKIGHLIMRNVFAGENGKILNEGGTIDKISES